MHRRRQKTAPALLAVLAAAALVAGCTSGSSSGPSGPVAGGSSGSGKGSSGSGGVLNVGMPNGPQANNSNPFLGTSAGASLGYRFMIYEPLVMMNGVRPSDKGKPWLASDWEWTDNYKKVTFTIRDNVKWSDGKPLSAEDVVYTFDLMKQTPALNVNAVPFKGVALKGSNQVELTFASSQFVNQTKILNQFVVPKHIWSTVKDPSTWTNQQPVGSGPYTLKSFTPQTVTLTLRDSYWKDLPKVSELRYTSFNDNSAQTTALANGASEWSFVFMPNYKQLYINKDAQHNKLWFPSGLGIHGLWFNTAKKPLDNPALRRAINLVIDREAIYIQAEATLYPKIENPTGIPLPAGAPYLAPEYKDAKLTVDVDAAKKELTDAGFSYDGDTLKDPSGKPVKITLTDPSGWSDYLTGLSIIKDGMKKIGIAADVRTQTVDAWTSAVNNGDFDAVLHWTNGGATPYDMYQNVMDGSLYQPLGKAATVGNYGRFKNDDATKALEQYANASDEATRTDALNKLQKIMVEQVPMAPTSAAPIGAEYSTKHWTGWPDDSNPYGPSQPTQPNALDVVLHLQPAS
ncbi:ABC transporter substrate-binding protein [Peterkaempfera bronchialis]|uniref:ABC transporter substrate-binding protein n=1 Tax=Peterkaempfera bronchialis TaxID=2126346 RepID=A0A345SSZ3_9ACTN|nr:ABC transporter substrate-binding protein [Peterkaempfera bronchialis]AXI76848.1 ABC transporter substrate-binding protein [Peterkaempfera bronchialis]